MVDDAELLDLVEMEMRAPDSYDYDGDNTPIIRGSAGALNGEAQWVDTVMKLMEAVDDDPCPARGGEALPDERGGRVLHHGSWHRGHRSYRAGVVKVGDEVEIIGGMKEEKMKSTCTGVEMFRKLLDRGEAGDNCGLLLRGIEKNDDPPWHGDAKPGSITPHTEFQARCTC